MDLGAIILSGGKSSRFGTDKGLFLFKEIPLISYAINLCKSFSDNTIAISNNEKYLQFGLPVYSDIYKDKGPMGGIQCGLFHSKKEVNLIISCDSPFINNELIKMMLSEYQNEDVIICQTFDGKYHPMLGIYHKRILNKLERSLKNNQLKLIEFISNSNHKIINIPKNSPYNSCFVNFNYQSDILDYEK